jgi:hypothetical protein
MGATWTMRIHLEGKREKITFGIEIWHLPNLFNIWDRRRSIPNVIFSSFSFYSDENDRSVQALHTTEKKKKRDIWDLGVGRL